MLWLKRSNDRTSRKKEIGLMEDSVDFVSRALLYLEKGAKDGQATRKR